MSLNKEELARADLRSGERVIRRGRPPSVAPKQAVNPASMSGSAPAHSDPGRQKRPGSN
jgi:hypothetical protein